MYENVILIPYRDRETHLKYFLSTLWPVIKNCLTNVKLVIIEQVGEKSFNRGKLLNVGFKEYLDKTNYFITHDVDIIPSINILKQHYNVNMDIYIIYSSHGSSFGGITKFSNDSIKKNNGFQKIDVPQYYIPLSLRGKIGLSFGLLHGFSALLPSRALRLLSQIRSLLYAKIHEFQKCSRSEEK